MKKTLTLKGDVSISISLFTLFTLDGVCCPTTLLRSISNVWYEYSLSRFGENARDQKKLLDKVT